MSEEQRPINSAFLGRAIRKAQRLSIDDPFCRALNEYIVKARVLAWDDASALFWVKSPEGWQVATWLMPVALQFDPTKEPNHV